MICRHQGKLWSAFLCLRLVPETLPGPHPHLSTCRHIDLRTHTWTRVHTHGLKRETSALLKSSVELLDLINTQAPN